MEFNKRTVLWIVFAISLIVLWNNWMVANGKQSMFSPARPAQVAQQKTSDVPAAPQAGSNAVPGVPATPGAPAVPGGAPVAAVASPVVTVTTDVVKVDIDPVGGVIKRLEMLQYRDHFDKTKNQVLFSVNGPNVYLGQTGLIGTTAAGVLPNHTTPFTVRPGVRTLGANGQVQVVMDAEQGGVRLTKTLTFRKGDYLIGVRHDVTNIGTAPVQPSLYLQLQHDGTKPATDSWFMPSYTGPTLYTNADKYQKLTFEKIEKGSADHALKADNGWVAISQHFFVSAFIPADRTPRDIFTKKIATNLYAIGTVQSMGTVAPGATVSVDSRLYSGPQDERTLETITPGLELVKDYGMLTVIAKPIFWVMTQLHAMLGNWGWTIVALTILIKLAFFPLSAAGYRSMAKMRVVTPKMQAIRERFKSDPVKMQQATMELYKTEKINPLGGCLPILVQMPVFFALYWVLQASVEMRGAPWIGWIQDLTQPDPFYILPVIYAVSMFITTKLNPQPTDPVQAKMMLFMPIAFSVVFFFFPSGLVLYWVVNNILSIAQQWVITRKFETAAAK
ncbi:membrane protein insertase YidC [Oxalobacteraceae sp. CFBP 13730]|jgi:YidC/Oxa1 family membrane protein insertase|uniref:Membrane protein insertase YidC n=1 Tax=Massilia aurea TaxID=373040 RepID=A0A7W9X193_9BURK|nr:membrane protein insertase YidC [Massilia aurea]MBB6134617.1 YidC/Oxa1 family membrane protein insertase [Massilia aurea]MBD8567251.1 membrane protein insertase YidC [Oxalobacteraceae sp. CFBP 8763]MBD8657292.1 membrane protein insertase YidC [Oxalobacteraceae sp. CFBP 13730]RYE69472.1 MAG: membrane protein insertase YidC [Oxalobacteraceae bacterium]